VKARRDAGAVEIFARLSIEADEQQGQVYELCRPVVNIGRYRDNDIVLTDRLVAKRHARLIWQEDGSYMMDDLGAFTGIMLNGRRLTSHKSQPQARARV
jgi:ABC transport system ATP-binding/permease protein